MFIVQKPKEKFNIPPIRQATVNEFFIYCEHSCGPGEEDRPSTDFTDIIEQLDNHDQRIELLENNDTFRYADFVLHNNEPAGGDS